MIRHNINSRNWKKFKSFTGEPYYYCFIPCKNMALRNVKKFSGNYNIFFPFWVDNYKRLNRLYNNVFKKLDILRNKEKQARNDLFECLRKHNEHNSAIVKIDNLLYVIKYDENEFTWNTQTLNWYIETGILTSINNKTSFIQGHQKDIIRKFKLFLKAHIRVQKYYNVFYTVQSHYSNVLEHIILYKIKTEDSFINKQENEFIIDMNIDSDTIRAKVTRQSHDYHKIDIEFCRNYIKFVL